MQLKFQKKILNKDQGHTNLVAQKYFELANTIVHSKFLKHSHWVTQATYPVTQETNKRRYWAKQMWKEWPFLCHKTLPCQYSTSAALYCNRQLITRSANIHRNAI